MSRLDALTTTTARGTSARLLGELAQRGTPGEMVSRMAHSPAVLGGYLDLNRHTKRAKLDRRISELMSVAIQARLGCSVCLAAHEAAARGLGADEEDLRLARAGTAREPAEAALVSFGVRTYTEPTAVTDEEIDGLRAWGFSDREIADVVAVMTINVLTGTFNLVSGLSTPVVETTVDTATP